MKIFKNLTKEEQQKIIESKDFEGYDLTDADLRCADLSYANLKNVNLKSAYCVDTNFENANLKNANLEFAYCVDANFKNSDLTSVDFSYSDLAGANFEDAYLYCAKFGQANLKNTILERKNIKEVTEIEKKAITLDKKFLKETLKSKRVLAAFYSLPALKGTYKQKKWAEEIREEFLKEHHDDWLLKIFSADNNSQNATFWIDNRKNVNFYEQLKKYS